MQILVTGTSGLIGCALVPVLTAAGHTVTHLVRSQPRPGQAEIFWDPAVQHLPTPALEGCDAVVHLAGESIAQRRWTPEHKARIYHSRVQGTRLLCDALLQLVHPPKTFVCASAIGYYGDRGERLMREESAPGTGFLAEVCRAWEAAAAPAAQRGIRVVSVRFGVVLSAAGGALARMLLPFRLGAGGVIGSGKQYVSWVALDDAAGAIRHVLETDILHGPVNVVAPRAVTNRVLTETLGRVLRRPTILPLPAFAARLLFGEMADALLLASTRVDPGCLQATAYPFQHPELEGALRHVLGRTQRA